jgi:hypothetical protein
MTPYGITGPEKVENTKEKLRWTCPCCLLGDRQQTNKCQRLQEAKWTHHIANIRLINLFVMSSDYVLFLNAT